MSTKILIAPGRYVQGPGVIAEIGPQVKRLGKKALVTAGRSAMAATREGVGKSLEGEGVAALFEPFNGECCDPEIERLKAIAAAGHCDTVVCVGGGKVIDTGKAVAEGIKAPVVVVPTIAATDAPCSALSVIYSPEGVFNRYFMLTRNPDLVLVDTSIIARAPVRFLVSGMGDALATWFEADSCFRASARNMAGGYTTASALALARLCYDLLLEYGETARLAVERGVATPAVEKVVEANTLLSGIGFESSGLAAAHAVHDGLTVLPETRRSYHGEKVAIGTLTHLVMEDRSTVQIREVLRFCCRVGLPVTLAEIGIADPTPEKLLQVAEKTCRPGMTIHNMPFPVTPQRVYDALVGADALGRAYQAEEGKRV